MSKDSDVVVIGGGVIGLASALTLIDAGRSVIVIDAGRSGGGSSHGNCGTLTPSHAAPLAAPGAIGKALRWMLTPDAPFYLKPRLDPALWAWLLRFAARCNRRDWRNALVAKAAILNASLQTFPEWISRYGLECEFDTTGTDYVFRDAAKFEDFCNEARTLADFGIPSEFIAGDAYRREEPAVVPGVRGVVRFAGNAHLRPDRYVAELARVVRERGGEIIENNAVHGLHEDSECVRIIAENGEHRAREALLASGAWSPRLAASLQLRLPGLCRAMQPGKGYSITYDRPALTPRRPIVLYERSVCVTTWESGFRLGSTMEFAGYDDSLNRRRLDALERGAREYLHDPVGPLRREEWFGWRPMTYDDVPIIGRAPGWQRLWLATGHGMLGVSMSTATAQLIGDLICARETAIDPVPYRIERFA